MQTQTEPETKRNEINSVFEDESVMGIVVVRVVANNHFAHTFQPWLYN